MLEKNTKIRYLSLTGLHKFNQQALDAICDSMVMNSGLKLVDFKKCTEDFYIAIDQGVNLFRDRKIVFLHDPKWLKSKYVGRSYSPDRYLQQSLLDHDQDL
jgi:hypothetical protein